MKSDNIKQTKTLLEKIFKNVKILLPYFLVYIFLPYVNEYCFPPKGINV